MSEYSGGRGFSAEKVGEMLNRPEPPVWTAQRLADELGVSRQTIHNNAEKIKAMAGVGTMEVGQATVYYRQDPDSRNHELTPTLKGIGASSAEAIAAGTISRWRFAVHRATAVRRAEPVRGRAWLHHQLVELVEEFERAHLSIRVAATADTDGSEFEWRPGVDQAKVEEGEQGRNAMPEDTVIELVSEDFELSANEIKQFLREQEFYMSAGEGPLRGFGSLIGDPVATPLADDHGRVDFDENDEEAISEALPDYGDLLEAGELWIAFLGDLYGWGWR